MGTHGELRLAALSELRDYRVRAEDTDPRGWEIRDAQGIPVGTVEDLIIDLDVLTARYIVCSLLRGARAVLVPTGFARIETEQCAVHLDFIRAEDVDALPSFGGLPVGTELLADIERVLTGAVPTTSHQAKIVRRHGEPDNAS